MAAPHDAAARDIRTLIWINHAVTGEVTIEPRILIGLGQAHGWKMSPTWYVTLEVHKRGVLPKPRHPRLTTTFETEAEAKNFARAKLLEGLVVFAGTINPYLPRQLISSNRIAAWAAEEQDE